ncbi:hypothetical protein MA16_Dca020216 [Dendrobium catenatum]|uniref:Uncharacterized protein n=1 Tax=Dendrobium catenatum TaxID=906689 RepID=A0A2I0V8V0_9ASPA|nr:hypothetical protein MA16_Dca020216 [Dendrobium catenatum]
MHGLCQCYSKESQDPAWSSQTTMTNQPPTIESYCSADFSEYCNANAQVMKLQTDYLPGREGR